MDIAVEVKDVIGPFPFDESGMIMLEAEGKMFPVWCGFLEAEGIRANAVHRFVDNVLKAAGTMPNFIRIASADNSLYCQLYFEMPSTKKLSRLPVTSPAIGIQIAKSGGIPLFMSEHDRSRLVDASVPYGALKAHFKTLWPLPAITDTYSLRLLSDFIDEVIPDGSVFSR